MTHTSLMRLSGLVAMLTGAVIVLFNLAVIGIQFSPMFQNVRTFITTILLVFVFTGLYARQYQRAGLLGLVGYIVTVVSLIFNIALRYGDIFIGPVLFSQFPDSIPAIVQGPYSAFLQVTFILFVLGYVLFGIATFRAQELPRWAAVLLIVGAVFSYALVMLPINIGSILANTGLAWMGYSQWAGTREASVSTVQQPAV